jgi:uncharacterized protein (TIGR03067 family)
VLTCIPLLLALSLVPGSEDEDATKKDYARFGGVWKFELVEVEGAKQPDAPFDTNKIIVGRDGRFVVVQGERITRGKFKLDATKTPKHFDFTVTDGPGKDRTMLAIYELEGDSYQFCGSIRGNQRPAALLSRPGSGTILHVLKRQKQEVASAWVEVDRRALAGTWQAISYALDGKKAPDEDMRKIKLSFDADGKATAIRDGKVFIAGSTQIDPTANPMSMNVTYTEGDPKGQTAFGIYKIEGDLLTICRSAPGQARPTEFASTPGSGHTLMTYQRDKAPATTVELPPAVRRTLEAEATGGKIESLRTEKDEDGATVYWANVTIGGRAYSIGILADGTLTEMKLSADDAELSIDRCPPSVRSTIRSEAFGQTVGTVGKDVKYGVTIYETTITHQGKSYEIVVAEDGTLVEKVLVIDDEEVELARCPAAVQAALRKHAGGGTIHDITRSTGIAGSTFEAEVDINAKVYLIDIAQNGLLISKSLEAGED